MGPVFRQVLRNADVPLLIFWTVATLAYLQLMSARVTWLCDVRLYDQRDLFVCAADANLPVLAYMYHSSSCTALEASIDCTIALVNE